MTPSRSLRPVLLVLAGFATSSCGMVESDPNRFETMAQAVADIPLDGEPPSVKTAAEMGLRPAMVSGGEIASPGALRVEVMDPHDLWDARDAGLRGAVEQAAPAMMEAAAPVVAQAVLQHVTDRMPDVGAITTSVRPTRNAVETLQLGAFSSPEAARAAWRRISAAGSPIAALTPAFEAVEVDGRTLTRLKVVAGADAARAVCRAADAAALGCLRRG